MLAICCLSFILRIFLIDAQSIWWDEAISLHLATSNITDLLVDRAAHIHPPLYFILLKGWVALTGTSAFGARFFSAWFNTLLPPVVYVLGCRWLDRRTGLIGSLLVALSPLYVIYSQEVRVYALLPLVYLIILAQVNRLTASLALGRWPVWRIWLLFVCVEVVGLYLHYIVLPVIAYANLLLLLRLWRCRRQLVCWLISLALVVFLCLPWVVAVALNWEAVLADVGVGDSFVEPVPFGHFVRLLWAFQWSGLTTAPGYAPLRVTSLSLVVLLAFALAALLWIVETRRSTLRLLAHWLVPLSSALPMWQAKPLSHPRYVSLFAVALLFLVGYTLAQLYRQHFAGRILAVLLGFNVIVTSAIALRAWYFVPRFAKDDTRGAAAAIAARSTADDLVLVPPEDWSIPYYYDGRAPVEMIWPGDDTAADWERIAALTRQTRTVFLVDYYRATRDPRALLPFALESAGYLSDRWDFKGLYVRAYRLERSAVPPILTPCEANFGPLRLIAAWIEPAPASDTALTVALRWRMEKPDANRYRVGLRLRDADGWGWATTDDWLLDETAAPTEKWPAGKEATTYHVLPLMRGTPPLTYTLAVGVYREEGEAISSLDLLDEARNPRGQSYEVGDVSLAPALDLFTDPYGVAPDIAPLPVPVALADGLLLEAAALDRQTVAPGQSIYVTLRWRAAAPLPDLRPTLALIQGSATLVAVECAPAGGRYSTDRWEAGETVLEHRRLTIPSTAADGPATLTIEVEGRRVVLGEVEIGAGERLFTPPPMAQEVRVRFGDGSGEPGRVVAELLGYDLALGPYTSDQPISITLYWRALEGATAADYTVFAHILAADGHLVGQHDGPPAAGGRPTPGWLPGEIITDRHEMTFRELYTGQARIEVGLYDSETMERVPTESGETFFLLSDELTISER